jgi:vacuolar-type H+-ATPase catalytic subunit A/Vma1
MSNHENLILMFEAYQTENEKFVSKNNKAAGTRARKALAEIAKAAKERRKEIQEVKTDKEKSTE